MHCPGERVRACVRAHLLVRTRIPAEKDEYQL